MSLTGQELDLNSDDEDIHLSDLAPKMLFRKIEGVAHTQQDLRGLYDRYKEEDMDWQVKMEGRVDQLSRMVTGMMIMLQEAKIGNGGLPPKGRQILWNDEGEDATGIPTIDDSLRRSGGKGGPSKASGKKKDESGPAEEEEDLDAQSRPVEDRPDERSGESDPL
jgi:hypothetical protein